MPPSGTIICFNSRADPAIQVKGDGVQNPKKEQKPAAAMLSPFQHRSFVISIKV
jgi:hypothetical protein